MSKVKGSSPQGKSNHPEERLPPANTIEQKYLEVLEETLTPPEVRKRLVESQSLEQKWRFIQIHKPLSEEKLATWGDKETTVLNTINNSRNPDIMSVLNLKVLLSSANKELMASFLEANGVAVLLKVILQKVNKKPITTIDVALLYEILLCCKLVMNNAIGMKGFLDVMGAIDTIALCLLFEYKPLALLVSCSTMLLCGL
ncbi:hypothetical protein EON65_50825 [archaeon]|nr:MAG: hypothetical protein EON65_50825 [archaeon]